MTNKFSTSGPHINSKETIETNMWNVVFALTPAVIIGTYFFGLYVLYLVLASALSAVIFEKPFVKSKSILGDGSAFLAGTLLGLTLSPAVPWWIPILGGFLTVIIGKHLFGGLGSNIFNPALIARAILLLSYPSLMTRWVSPIDGISAATPLEIGAESFSYAQLVIGNIPGSVGETSVIALLIGGIYLYIRDYIDLKIPLSFIIGAGTTAYIFGLDPLFAVFSGGLIFGAIYMATDMVTSPVNKWAKIVYGLIGGFLTIYIRRYTPYPEGITFAILIINGASYLFDNMFEGPYFGEVEHLKHRAFQVVSILLVSILILFVGFIVIEERDNFPGNLTYSHLKQTVQKADSFEIIEQDNNDLLFSAKDKDELISNLVYISRNGFEAPIEILLSINSEGEILDTKIVSESESPTLGARIKDESFLNQFNRFSIENTSEIMDNTDLISGATFSSQTVARAVRAGLELYISDKNEGLIDGVYQASAQGAQGMITIEIEIEDRDITNVKIVEDQETKHLAQPAYEELKEQLLSKQNADLDIVSGATYTSEAFIEAVQSAIDKASSNQNDNKTNEVEYIGSAQGHADLIEVKVLVENESITDIEILSQNETPGIGDQAINELKQEIIDKQTLEVDMVSGATNSSKGLINAIRDALDLQQDDDI
ncbi:MAG: RnfABCDGE type electron transport complex subunit D [Bacillota bacterium]